MKSKKIKTIILFLIGFCGYITMEVLFRRYSYPLMGLCGSISILCFDKINDKISWDIDILVQGICGSLLITFIELVIGEMFIHGYLPAMWDYSNMPLNYKGIICLPFSLIWVFVTIFAIMVADAVNYYVFEELPVPYYKLFGRTIITFNKKYYKL